VLSHTEIISFFSLDKIDTGLHPPPIYRHRFLPPWGVKNWPSD
jgi:hypothetical protein